MAGRREVLERHFYWNANPTQEYILKVYVALQSQVGTMMQVLTAVQTVLSISRMFWCWVWEYVCTFDVLGRRSYWRVKLIKPQSLFFIAKVAPVCDNFLCFKEEWGKWSQMFFALHVYQYKPDQQKDCLRNKQRGVQMEAKFGSQG